MDRRRVLLFSAQGLLGESIQQTLSGVEDLEIAGHWPIDGQVMGWLSEAAPDFIVFADDGTDPEQLSHLTAKILDQYPDLPVFRVTLSRNQLQVFSSHLVPARSANFLDLFQQPPPKSHGSIESKETP